jgi:hypothetical protein
MTANQKRSAWTKAWWAKLRENPKLYERRERRRIKAFKKSRLLQRMKGN